ncbi:MAG: AtpZ/AtpI family protein [Planctomycetota bacterium]
MAPDNRQPEDERFVREVDDKAHRKIRWRQLRKRSPWFWAGMFGLVGWPVAMFTAIGTWIGIKLDAAYPGNPSWTLTGIFVGMGLGCLNAWYWIKREQRED